MLHYIAHGDRFAWVSDAVRGAMFGHLEVPWYGSEAVATELLLYAEDGSGGRLVRQFTRWAAERRARAVMIASSSGLAVDRTAVFYERLGLPQVGTVHRRMLP